MTYLLSMAIGWLLQHLCVHLDGYSLVMVVLEILQEDIFEWLVGWLEGMKIRVFVCVEIADVIEEEKYRRHCWMGIR